MSGLVKAKKYDWADSNLALFGSDTEKQVGRNPAVICVFIFFLFRLANSCMVDR